jgi:RimJ/RimL family protein N-acetyltransferase
MQTQFLTSEHIYLRPVEKSDLVHLQKWVNDLNIRGIIGSTLPMDQQGIEEWFEKSRGDSSRVWFVICTKEDNRVIGECGLLRMFPAWRTTDLSIIIGEKDTWGKGYGTEAINLLLDYAFGYLNFHRVSIGVVGFNESALRFYEKIGFKREGIQRDGYYYNYVYSDFVMMSILENEFRDLHGG